MRKEVLFHTAEIGLTILGLYGLSFLAFSRELKEQVRKEQKGFCDWCGRKVKKLQIHHIRPQSMGGKDTRDNAIGLCRECHEYWDRLALEEGIFYGKKTGRR